MSAKIWIPKKQKDAFYELNKAPKFILLKDLLNYEGLDSLMKQGINCDFADVIENWRESIKRGAISGLWENAIVYVELTAMKEKRLSKVTFHIEKYDNEKDCTIILTAILFHQLSQVFSPTSDFNKMLYHILNSSIELKKPKFRSILVEKACYYSPFKY